MSKGVKFFMQLVFCLFVSIALNAVPFTILLSLMTFVYVIGATFLGLWTDD